MNKASGESYVGLLSFLAFGFSVMAAVLAIDMYALLRTGEFAKTWRVLIIASVMFALMQALRLSELLNFASMSRYHLSEVVELMFVMSLTYAFYLQRSVFGGARSKSERPSPAPLPKPITPPRDYEIPDEETQSDAGNEALEAQSASKAQIEAADDRADEWARLTGNYESGSPVAPRAPDPAPPAPR